MARAAAAIRDDGGRALHDRFPVRIRHVGDEHVAGLHLRHVLHVMDDARRARADALADAASLDQHLRAPLERESLDGAARTALHGFGARLQDIDLAGGAVLAPFDVHRRLVVFFDDQRLLRERDEVGIVEREAHAIGNRDVHRLHAFAGARLAVDHLDGLATEIATNDRRLACAQRRLVDVELVGIHRALHDGLAETI